MKNNIWVKNKKKENELIMFFRDSIENDLFLYCACMHELSSAESDIVKELLKGRTTREISKIRHISPKTVSVQKRSAFRKMRINSDIELVHYFYFLKRKLKNITDAFN